MLLVNNFSVNGIISDIYDSNEMLKHLPVKDQHLLCKEFALKVYAKLRAKQLPWSFYW